MRGRRELQSQHLPCSIPTCLREALQNTTIECNTEVEESCAQLASTVDELRMHALMDLAALALIAMLTLAAVAGAMRFVQTIMFLSCSAHVPVVYEAARHLRCQ